MSRLFSLVGTPSPAFYTTLNVVKALATAVIGEHDVVCANTMVELGDRLSGLSTPPERCVILYSDYPQPDVLPAFTAIDAPLVICADDFLTIAHFSVVWREYGGVDAARFASMGLVNIEPLISAPPRSSMIVDDTNVVLGELVSRLARLYGLSVDEAARQAIRSALGQSASEDETLKAYAARTQPEPRNARSILDGRSPLETELLDLLAPHYGPIARGRRLERLEWPPFALLRPDFPDRLTVGPIDLTGPARFIYYGPYFALPRGRWRAELILEVSDCYSDNQIAIDVVSGGVLAAVKAKLPAQGVYSCELAFAIWAPSNPVEIRLQLLTGAIEGMLMLRSIRLNRVAPPARGGDGSGAS
jgi:hypothetical protein